MSVRKMMQSHAFGMVILLNACSSSSRDSNEIAPSSQRSGKEVVSVEKEYSDLSPRLSDDGMRMVFISGRAPHQGTYQAYKFDLATDVKPSMVSSEDLGEVLDIAISPDGNWVSLKTIDMNKNIKLYIQKYDDSAKRLAINDTDLNFSDMSFSDWTTPALVVTTVDSQGIKKLKVISFESDNGQPKNGTVQVASDFSALEESIRWVNTTDMVGILSRLPGSSGGAFIYRARALGASEISTATQIKQQDDLLWSNLSAAVGDLGITYSYIIADRSVSYEPESNKDVEIRKVFPRHQVAISSFSGALSKQIETKQYAVTKVSSVRAGGLIAILGSEVFACKAAGDDADFYGSSLVFYLNGATSKVLFKYSSEEGYSLVTQDYCDSFEEGVAAEAQPIDLQIKDVELAGDFSSGIVRLVFQTWHKGDDEIFHLSMNFDGRDFSNSVFTAISRNQKAQ